MVVRYFSLKLESFTRVGGVFVLPSFSCYYQPQQQPTNSLKGTCGIISLSQLTDVRYIQVAPKIPSATGELLGEVLCTDFVIDHPCLRRSWLLNERYLGHRRGPSPAPCNLQVVSQRTDSRTPW